MDKFVNLPFDFCVDTKDIFGLLDKNSSMALIAAIWYLIFISVAIGIYLEMTWWEIIGVQSVLVSVQLLLYIQSDSLVCEEKLKVTWIWSYLFTFNVTITN